MNTDENLQIILSVFIHVHPWLIVSRANSNVQAPGWFNKTVTAFLLVAFGMGG
jgi:hypothetical protein